MENLILFNELLIIVSFIPLLYFAIKGLFVKKVMVGLVALVSVPLILTLSKWLLETISSISQMNIPLSSFIFSIILNAAFIIYLIAISLQYAVFNVNMNLFEKEVNKYSNTNTNSIKFPRNSLSLRIKGIVVRIHMNRWLGTLRLNNKSYKLLSKELSKDIFQFQKSKFNYQFWILIFTIMIYAILAVPTFQIFNF